MSAFMEVYDKVEKTDDVGIPNFEMNRPFAPVNGLSDIGLELEIEGVNLPTTGKLEKLRGPSTGAKWEAKTDGSLRGEALEYVLDRPCAAGEVETLVSGLYDLFNDNGTTLTLTNRCSTHVHVNMGGKKVNHITSAIALWTAFEEPLIAWAGEERDNNHFCLGAKDCNTNTVTAWRSFLKSGGRRWGDNLKYSALNILTLDRFGSLEYRVMNASDDPRRIVDWTKFIHGMTDYACKQFTNPATMAYSLSEKGGRELFLEICEKANVSPSFVTGVQEAIGDMNYSVLRGFRRAQPIVAGFPWYEWTEMCEKEYVENPFGGKKKTKTLNPPPDWLDDRVIPVLEVGGLDPLDRRPDVDDRPVVRAIPPRPANVPTNSTYNHENMRWVVRTTDEVLSLKAALQRFEPTVVDFAALVAERGRAPRPPIDWRRPIRFIDGTAAAVVDVNSLGSSARVLPLANLVISEDLAGRPMSLIDNGPYWYDAHNGAFGGGGCAATVENVD